MKVSPMHGDDKIQEGYHKSIGGIVSQLVIAAKNFNLSKRDTLFSVNYSTVTQAGVDTLLQRAVTDGLKTKVRCSSYDVAARLCTAQGDAAIRVKVQGVISALDMTARTFTLTYQTNKTLTVDYTDAAYDGTINNGMGVEVVLYGLSGNAFLARKVEIEDDVEMDD